MVSQSLGIIVARFLGCAKEMPLSAAGKIRSRSHLGTARVQCSMPGYRHLSKWRLNVESSGICLLFHPATESSRRKFGWLYIYESEVRSQAVIKNRVVRRLLIGLSVAGQRSHQPDCSVPDNLNTDAKHNKRGKAKENPCAIVT
jgi:hypothetical protein